LDDKEGSEGAKRTHLRNTTTNLNEEEEKLATPRSEMDEEAKEPLTLRS
jgi:hypothetical protein